MGTLTVRPAGITFDAHSDETVIQAAWRNGYFWPTICNGQGMCKTCVFQVVEGADGLTTPSEFEQEGLDHVTPTLPGDADHYRLACQARITGDVVAQKIGVRARPPE